VRCWGANGDGQLGNGTRIGSLVPVAVGGLTSAGPGSAATTVVAGSWHTCALLATGAPKCWGRNADGQLGNGTTTRFLVPVAVAALTRVTVLSTGATHSCALLATGLVRCWGRNADGQLGNGLTVGSALPVAVVGLSAARPTTIAAGRSHTCATLTNGETRCWGRNASGQLGTGDTAGSAIPRAVTGLVSGVDVATGRDQSCGLAATGAVSCWGNNANGQLGNGTTTGSSTPVPALSVGGATSGLMVDGGPHHTCAILATGTAKCWGNNVNGGLGNGTLNVVPNPIPVPVGSLTGLRSISAGGNPATTGNQNSCAVEASGTVWCWGDNLRGQLGTGQDRFALPRSSTPVQVVGITNAVAVSTEDWHACAALSNGTVKCWGNNSRGELGNGTTTESNLPVTVLSPTSGNPSAPLTGVVEVTTGYLHSCALLANGTVRCWGSNANTGSAAPGNSLTPVAVGGVSGATAIAAGDQHACVLLAAGGSMKCWGTNFAGQLGDPAYPNTSSAVARAVPGIAGVSAMAVGVQHTCVVLAENGSVRCWGGNTVGQLGNGTVLSSGGPVTVRGLNNAAMLTGVTRLTAGSYHTCAVLAVGGVVSCWGQNHYGQLGNGTISNATTPVKTNL
jgi:alpha-tubulin suppressor-like RCC1 family protein